jgi:hypothetical protein
MAPSDPKHAFQQFRAENQRQQQSLIEAGRRVQQKWAAADRRSAACEQLLDLWPGQVTGRVDGDRVAALLVQWAATLSADWVHARVQFVRQRLAALATDAGADAPLKEILLELLLHANAGALDPVAAIVHEALRGAPDEVQAFRQALMNWLIAKVVEAWPPLPEELQPPQPAPAAADEAFLEAELSQEEWLPAAKAVERAERAGHRISLKWLTQDAPKHGVRLRPRQLPGRHKREVEWSSLAGYLLRQQRPEEEPDEEGISQRLRAAQEHKRQERSLD